MNVETTDLPFENISLSSDETEALKLLTNSNLLLDNESKEALIRLIRLGLAEKYRTRHNNVPCFGVSISSKGKDYFMYLKQYKRTIKKETRRYWITTTIAILALFLAIASLCWQAYTWRYELNQTSSISSFSSSDQGDSKSDEEPEVRKEVQPVQHLK